MVSHSNHLSFQRRKRRKQPLRMNLLGVVEAGKPRNFEIKKSMMLTLLIQKGAEQTS